MKSHTAPVSELPAVSRRREPRLFNEWLISVFPVSANGPAVVGLRDIGFRGFALETRQAVAPRTRARFVFAASQGPIVEADAVAIHCHLSLRNDDIWISGWEFPEQPDVDEAIDRLVDYVLDDLSLR